MEDTLNKLHSENQARHRTSCRRALLSQR